MPIVRNVIIWLVATTLILVFSDVSLSQAALGGMAAVTFFELSRYLESRREFQPFEFSIRPKWDEIVRGQQILTDDEFWELWQRAEDGETFRGSHLLVGAAGFEVLGPRLVYVSNYTRFRSEIDFDGMIDLAPSETAKYSSDLPAKRISLAVRQTHDGYRLGVRTHASLYKSHMPGDDMDVIQLAFLPKDAFLKFYKVLDKKASKLSEKRLVDNGWEVKQDKDPHWSLVPFPTELHHEYFVVAYREI